MIEFDPKKAAANFAKHGIHFADAEPVLYDPRAFSNDKVVGGELRHITTGTDALGRVITVVWTLRGQNQRLISARHSRRKERQFYEA
jgi:uncharacterized protein